MPEEKDYSLYTSLIDDDDDIASIRTFGSRQELESGISKGRDFYNQLVYQPQKTDPSRLFNYIPDFIKKGYNESVTGMAQQLATGEAPFDLEDYNPGVLSDIGAAVTSFFMPADLLAFAGGAGIGGQAAKKAGKLALKQMIRAGVKKEFAEDVLQKGAATLAGKAGIGAGTGAAALGIYSGIADAMAQEIDTNEIDFEEVLKTAGKSAVVGAVTGGIGGRAAFKGSSQSVRIAQEIAGFGVAEPLVDLRAPTPQDFLHAGGMVLGIRGANMALKVPGRIKRGEGIFQPELRVKDKPSPEFVKEQAELKAKRKQKQFVEGETWTSEKSFRDIKPGEQVKIVSDRTIEKGGKTLSVFQLENLKTGKSGMEIQKGEFFKQFGRSQEPMSPEALQKRRVGQVAGLQRKLTTEEFGLDNKFLAERKKQITGKKNISSKDMSARELFKYRKSLQYEKDLIKLKKELPNQLIEIEPGKTLVERIFPAKFVQPMLSAEARLKLGESQTLGLEMIPRADARRAEIVGTFVEEAVFASGLRKFKNPKEVADALEGKKNVSREARDIAKKVKVVFDKAYKLAEKTGIEVSGYIEQYFPRMMRKDIQKIIFDDLMPFIAKNEAFLQNKITNRKDLNMLNKIVQRSIQAGEFNKVTTRALNKLVKEGKLSYKQAMENLRSEVFSEMYSPFGNLEKKRKLKLPSDFYERNAKEVITRYLDKFGKRISSAEVFGKKGEEAKSLLEALRLKDPTEYKVMKELYANYTGLSSVDPAKAMSPAARKLADAIMSFEYGTKIGLGFATIPNVTQTLISTAVEAGYWRTVKGAARLLRPEVRKRIRQSGATHHNVMDILLGTDMGVTNPRSIREGLKKIVTEKGINNRLANTANLLTTVSGFKGINYINQLLAASTAEVYVKDLSKIARSKPAQRTRKYKDETLRYKWATRNLSRLGIKDFSKKLTDSNVENAMYRFAKESQLQKDILKDPLAFNNPKLRPLFIFKRFGFRQAKYAKDTFRREIQQGNVLVPLRMAAGGLMGLGFVNGAKDFLVKFFSGEDVVREDTEGFFERLIEAWGSVGSLGFFSDILDSEDVLSSLKFTLTPVVLSDLDKAYTGIESLQRNIEKYGAENWETYQRSVKGFAGLFGTSVKRFAERFETAGQKAKGISTEKGRIRSKIFEHYKEGNYKRAEKLYIQWNNKRESNPFTFEDISFPAYITWYARKEKERLNP